MNASGAVAVPPNRHLLLAPVGRSTFEEERREVIESALSALRDEGCCAERAEASAYLLRHLARARQRMAGESLPR